MHSRLAVVLVNWNGWHDTVACLDSLLPTLPPDARVLVCDNASADQSLSHLKQWAEGKLGAQGFAVHDRARAESGPHPQDPQLVLIDTGGNLGFAGGNNVGIRYALANGFDRVWLLNNDTVVDEHTASELQARMDADPDIGMCGSTMFYFDQPKVLQCLSGSAFDFRNAVGHPIGFGDAFDPAMPIDIVEARLDHISGASMMVSRAFLQQVGLMNEDYFLYFEEIDWAVRAQGRFKLGWAPRSFVWHKEGGSIGSSHRHRPSDKSLMHLCVNRLRFTRALMPRHYGSVRRRMLWEAAVYGRRRDWRAAFIYLHALTGWRFLLPSA